MRTKLMITMISLLLAACATPETLRPYVKAYPGSYMERLDVALVHVPAGSFIKTANGWNLPSRYQGQEIYVALEHGENTLTVGAQGIPEALVTFYARGGRNYALQTSSAKADMVDVTDRPGAWCSRCYLEPWTMSGTIGDPGWP